MSNQRMWKMATGQKIRIKDMTDSHLLNTIRMLQRKHQEVCLEAQGAASSFNGEMAQMYAEQEADCVISCGPGYVFDIYGDLVKEAKRRKLAV